MEKANNCTNITTGIVIDLEEVKWSELRWSS